MKLFLDTETYSEVPITNGTYRYVESCELMVVSWALDDEPVLVWDVTASGKMPFELRYALTEADEVWAHNAMFDRLVVAKHLPEIAPERERWRCMMVRALAHSLPGSLDKICEILRISEGKAKLKDGKDLVKFFCKPRPKKQKLRRATRETHPEKWARFLEYAANDIEAMREIDKGLPTWNYGDTPLAPNGEPWMKESPARRELTLWHLDQKINDRGFACDLELVDSALVAIDREQELLAADAQRLTGNAVQRATQRDALLAHLADECGIFLPDLKGSTVEAALDDPDLPEAVKELLRVRLQASTTSTSKYTRIKNGVTSDGRMKGTLQFSGAGRTARWAGRLFQPQNLARSTMPQNDIEYAVQAIKLGIAGLIW